MKESHVEKKRSSLRVNTANQIEHRYSKKAIIANVSNLIAATFPTKRGE